jgi:hypothetical protein
MLNIRNTKYEETLNDVRIQFCDPYLAISVIFMFRNKGCPIKRKSTWDLQFFAKFWIAIYSKFFS